MAAVPSHSSSPLPELLPPPTDTEDTLSSALNQGLSFTQVSLKHPSGSVVKKGDSLSSIITVSTTTSTDTDTSSSAPKSKKLKMPLPHNPSVSDVQREPSIVDIDDIDNLQDEHLNKSNPTADIKFFFTPLLHQLGHAKGCMRCNMCM